MKIEIIEIMKQQETCRTCLRTNGDYRNLFEDTQNNKLISELIMECVPITIQRNDKLPNNICSVCVEKLNFVLDFREMVIESNETLSQCLPNNRYDENKELEDGAKDELETIEIDTYSPTDVGENFNGNQQNQTSVDDKINDKLESNETSKTLLKNRNENVTEVLCLNNKNILENSNEVDKNSDISEVVSEELPNKLKYKNYDKRNRLVRGFNEEQLKVLINNPDCKRIMECGLSRKEKTDATVFCQECNKSYKFRYYVAVHAHTHTGNLPFKCGLCEFRAPKKYLLHQHMRMHSQTKDFLCIQCGKAFTSKHTLKAHAVIHSNDRPFKCMICGKTFKRLITLQKHNLGHQDVREFVCEECGKSFKHKSDLLNHKAIHTNEKKFACVTCGKKFLLKKRLDEHTKKHLGLKPFACDICGKRFTAKPTWQKHAWIHTGEKPFSCEVCGKKFRQRECIPRHMRIHTGETPHACTICPQRFKYSQQLSGHMKKHQDGKHVGEYQNKKVKKKNEEEMDEIMG